MDWYLIGTLFTPSNNKKTAKLEILKFVSKQKSPEKTLLLLLSAHQEKGFFFKLGTHRVDGQDTWTHTPPIAT